MLYVKRKLEQALEVGINAKEIHLPKSASTEKIIDTLEELNDDVNVNAILIQLPLPKHIDPNDVVPYIDPIKDVDGLTPFNVGNLACRLGGIVPCTPMGCMMLLQKYVKQDLSGMHAVIIGKSNLVGKPLAQMLLQCDCTVTIVHKATKNISEITKQADILIAAAGSPHLVKADWVKPGAYVLDVGINYVDGEIVGDVDFDAVIDKVAAISPVPGGVGPMTVACLLLNTTMATMAQHEIMPEYLGAIEE